MMKHCDVFVSNRLDSFTHLLHGAKVTIAMLYPDKLLELYLPRSVVDTQKA